MFRAGWRTKLLLLPPTEPTGAAADGREPGNHFFQRENSNLYAGGYTQC